MISRVTSIATALSLLGVASAWLPQQNVDRMEARDGSNLFNTTKQIEGRWLTTDGKPLRGVNLGSQFILEPWMASNTWSSMGCGGQNSEFDCVSHLGQSAANSAFQSHWGSWIVESDLNDMQSYGLNAIRIPLGYWLDESIVYSDSEHFPKGALSYLKKICGWASDRGFYIVLGMHGAPGAQVAQNAFTGQYASTPGFYVDYQYERALKFLEYLVTEVHSNTEYRNVGMIELVNEPLQNTGSQTTSMRESYYKDAWDRVHSKEDSLGVTGNGQVHLLVMNDNWGSGNPTEWMNGWYVAYDDHRYLKYDSSVSVSQSAYLSASCNDASQSDSPGIVGEFSLSPPDNVEKTSAWAPSDNKDFYTKWFAAQVSSYEKHNLGWFFWSWKTELGDYRWSYKEAVEAGVIPKDPGSVDRSAACS
ncbi:endoglucanase 2 [Grosmannia clavigera kw1407]|uniref:glucan endo-1,6-beta-glucosidase n=1 Tax=Grosmannia clavigera (strain kw1407 / UAMH 11150) TaxID=655863 RepID=F0XBW7_GROCL|nr:endoglucanase 2 [Grosmannia clavigera kw1407]EFX04331.1 endoglucanase 2 [Grosmannia clavigera kw1407]